MTFANTDVLIPAWDLFWDASFNVFSGFQPFSRVQPEPSTTSQTYIGILGRVFLQLVPTTASNPPLFD